MTAIKQVQLTLFLALAAVSLSLAGCSSTNSADYKLKEMPKFSHPRDITNPYLTLASLKQDILESKSSRVERTARPDLHKIFSIGGQTVEALVVEDKEFEKPQLPKGALDYFVSDILPLVEVTRDYFAQADDGAVYYLGEDVDEYKDGKISGHSGAWLWGKDTQTPGVLMPAHPKVGDKFMSEDVPKITWEKDRVVSISETVTVPAGTFKDCVKIKEVASDGTMEYKFYAPGIGCVMEDDPEGELRLKSHLTK